MHARRLYWQAASLATVAAALPLYATAETLHRLRGRSVRPLEAVLDRMDDRLDRAEQQLTRHDATRFLRQLAAWTDRTTDAVDRLLSRLTPRPAPPVPSDRP